MAPLREQGTRVSVWTAQRGMSVPQLASLTSQVWSVLKDTTVQLEHPRLKTAQLGLTVRHKALSQLSARWEPMARVQMQLTKPLAALLATMTTTAEAEACSQLKN